MIICPDCSKENIPGVDTCEQCGQSLSPLSKPKPSSELERRLAKDKISQLELREHVIVPPEQPVGEVLNMMVDLGVGGVLVVDGEELVGIFSERDALMHLGVEVSLHRDCPVADFMTASPVALEGKDKIAFALHKMDIGGYRHIPIKTDGKVTGIVSIRDILGYMTEHLAG